MITKHLKILKIDFLNFEFCFIIWKEQKEELDEVEICARQSDSRKLLNGRPRSEVERVTHNLIPSITTWALKCDAHRLPWEQLNSSSTFDVGVRRKMKRFFFLLSLFLCHELTKQLNKNKKNLISVSTTTTTATSTTTKANSSSRRWQSRWIDADLLPSSSWLTVTLLLHPSATFYR